MIKKAFIAPTSLIQKYGNKGDFHLMLSHLIAEDPEHINAYEHEIRNSKLPIILDNGLFENGKAEDMDSLIRKAIAVGATHVFAPDVLFDRAATEANIGIMAEKLEGTGVKMAGVVQANNVYDFLASYSWMVGNEAIDLIGLSILAVPESFKEVTKSDDITINRIACLQALRDLPAHKNTHLLGAGSAYIDILYAEKNCPWVVSHDSSSAIWNGLHGKRIGPKTLDVEGGKINLPVDFEWAGLITEEAHQTIEANIQVVNHLCN